MPGSARRAELQDSNRQVTEALDRQTATAEVLRVIASSPTDVEPVLRAIVEVAARLCGAQSAAIRRVVGQVFEGAAVFGPDFGSERDPRLPVDRDSVIGRAVLEHRTIDIPDLDAVIGDYPRAEVLRTHGLRAQVAVPLLSGGHVIGVLTIRSPEAHPFTEQQIALLETFADQAVIAIENARLFEELERRNRRS